MLERKLAEKHFEKEDAEAPDVDALVMRQLLGNLV